MADNYFDFLYGSTNSKKNKSDSLMKSENVAQDEAIGKPWTHRFTIYCDNPSTEFIESLKKGDCVVAVYEKYKETADTEKEAKKTSNE